MSNAIFFLPDSPVAWVSDDAKLSVDPVPAGKTAVGMTPVTVYTVPVRLYRLEIAFLQLHSIELHRVGDFVRGERDMYLSFPDSPRYSDLRPGKPLSVVVFEQGTSWDTIIRTDEPGIIEYISSPHRGGFWIVLEAEIVTGPLNVDEW